MVSHSANSNTVKLPSSSGWEGLAFITSCTSAAVLPRSIRSSKSKMSNPVSGFCRSLKLSLSTSMHFLRTDQNRLWVESDETLWFSFVIVDHTDSR